ncbi:hypothetical protein RBB84_19565 [Rhodococcus sp. D-6]|uniref:Uncharacterized protein n=1 Tax=Rhodococcus sp. D-6 TaxID=1387842 RepID=A0AAU7UVK8_9NOCA
MTPTGPPSVQEPEDFRRLSIVATTGQSPSAVLDALLSANLAVVESTPETIKLDVSAFRDAARAALSATPTPEWETSFAAMLDYAQHRGWYQPDTGTVAAHIEWTDTTR